MVNTANYTKENLQVLLPPAVQNHVFGLKCEFCLFYILNGISCFLSLFLISEHLIFS